MSTKLKLLILEKILPNTSKNALNNHIRNMKVTHKSGDENFYIDFNLNNRAEKIEDTGQHLNNIRLCHFDTQKSCMRFGIEKNFFMKQVIEGILTKTQIHNVIENIVIDYSSPNIAKPFHVGHLRSTIIGNFIGNVNNYFNNKVTRINYLGDWGTQFGLLQYGMKAKNIKIEDLKQNPIKSLYESYVFANKLQATDENVQIEARRYFANIENGKADLEDWRKIRDITVHELKKIYQRLGVHFDEYHWESDYNGSAIKRLIKSLENSNILKTDDFGKKVAKFKNKYITIIKSDNSSLYISRDIAALLDRYEKYNFDKMLYVVDNAQTDHFAAVFSIVHNINEKCASGAQHVKFGRIRGMSTRSGNVIFLNDILDEAKHKMFDKQQHSKSNITEFSWFINTFGGSNDTRKTAMDDQTCDILGTSAVIINDLKQRRLRDYDFEWDKALQSEGDSGIKLQYLHCRLWSLEKNCGVLLPDTFEPQFLPEQIVSDVIAELAKFDDVLLRAKNELEACIIVNYLFKLSRIVNRMFNESNVKNVNPDLASQRLIVFYSARLIIKTGLEILGLKPLCEM